MSIEIKSLNLSELQTALKGQPAFRAKQIYTWLHRGVRSFDEMTDLPRSLREKLAEEYLLTAPQAVRRQESKLDGTVKYLWQLHDGNCVETVLMKYHHGNTVCISSEVGCPMGCAFCASTIGGLVRRLSAGEMLDEVLFTEQDSGQPISNIVLMGIGEPLDNYDNVCRFLELVNSGEGMNIGMRHISLSTCGLVPRIYELAKLDLQITLSVSLHAPTNEKRSQIMPVNQAYPIEKLMEACRDYIAKTNRRISYEYALIRDFNDTPECASQLAALLHGTLAHVNLIRLNAIDESPLRPSTTQRTQAFCDYLNAHGVTATVRRRLGFDIDASCGQLRRKYQRGQTGEEGATQ